MTSGQSLLVQGGLDDARDVVVFLPPAGSVGSPFLPVGARLPAGLPALHCEVPGRGRLAGDEAPATVSAAVDRWRDDLAVLLSSGRPASGRPANGRPASTRLHLFGHSLGALFAYELAARVHEQRPGYEIASLSVSGAREPGSAPRTLVATAFAALRRDQRSDDQDGDADGTWLTRDLRIRREHRISRESVPAPLALFCSDSDPFARPAEMAQWRHRTTGPFLGTFTFPGGHDYYLSGPEPIAAAIASIVHRCRELQRTSVSENQPVPHRKGPGHDR